MTPRRGSLARSLVGLFAVVVSAWAAHHGIRTSHPGVVLAALVLVCTALLLIATES